MLFFLAHALAAPPLHPSEPERVVEVPIQVDVDALFAKPPDEGVTRCRSRTPNVVRIQWTLLGGAHPPPEMVNHTQRWIIDGTEVLATTHRANDPKEPSTPVLRMTADKVEYTKAKDPGWQTFTETGILEWSNGAVVLGDAKQLELTWACERVWTGARP